MWPALPLLQIYKISDPKARNVNMRLIRDRVRQNDRPLHTAGTVHDSLPQSAAEKTHPTISSSDYLPQAPTTVFSLL